MNPFHSVLRAAALASALAFALPFLVRAQVDETSRSWNQPVEPFRIIGNVYYVGASDVTAYLITGSKGHIIIDSGFVETVPQIIRNIEKLGFELDDVIFLLSSHAHGDHGGGMALLKKRARAEFYASEEDAALFARGGKGDYALGDRMPYAPVQADRIVRDYTRVVYGDIVLVARLTPGHTKGCTTWTMVAEEGGRKYDVVFPCSTTVLPGVTLLKNDAYPKIADDFAQSFRILKSLPCDVFLANHGSFFNLTEKAARLAKGERPNPFVDPAGYRAYLDRMEKAYLERLEKEKAAALPPRPPLPPAPCPSPGEGEKTPPAP
jgi:metallo-beta-lactamase class B